MPSQDATAEIARRELEALRSGVRAVAETMVRTGRVPEHEVQSMLARLGVPPLERYQFRMEVPVSGVAIIDVMAADATEAKLLAGSIVDRGTNAMMSTMLPGGARLAKFGRSDEAHVVQGKLRTGGEVTIT